MPKCITYHSANYSLIIKVIGIFVVGYQLRSTLLVTSYHIPFMDASQKVGYK